jgi:hypothetical protein
MKKQTGSKATTKSKSQARTSAGKSVFGRSLARTGRTSAKTSQTTTDHDEIQQWAESRNGVPACVKKTGGHGDAGILRIDFPGGAEASLQQISWDEWFQKFDASDLVFLYQEKTVTGRTSRFNKLVSKETAGSQPKASSKGKTRTAGG